MTRTLLTAALLMCLASAELCAQWDSLTPSPSAVRFRRFWIIGGDDTTTIGYGAGALGDVNRDGFSDFCVTRHRRKGNRLDMESMIFYGNPDSTKLVPRQSIPGRPLARGDFWGTGKQALVFMAQRQFLFGSSDVVRVHRTDADSIETASACTFDTGIDSVDIYVLHISGAAAGDMDDDGYDDLIVTISYSQRYGRLDHTAEFWIYRGGPDFSLAQPTHVLRDTVEQSGGYQTKLVTGDLDRDGAPEIIAETQHWGTDNRTYRRLHIWWGRSNIELLPEFADYSVVQWLSQLYVGDYDGDGGADLFTSSGRLFLSGSGKNARGRTWSTTDAELRVAEQGVYTANLGPANDSTRRYWMVGVDRFISMSGWSKLVALSGSPSGPDSLYDASWYPAEEGAPSAMQSGIPVGDVNGDNWDDVLYATVNWGTYDLGVAAILLGGPYIPRDFEFSAIEDAPVPAAGTVSLVLWPNPVRAGVTFSWRAGSAARSVDVVDMLGRAIAHVAVAPGTTSAHHDCSGLPAGAYFAILRDGLLRPLSITSFQIH